jgi:carbonic anhydrase
LDGIPDGPRRRERLVELSVVEQCINVSKTAAVQRSYLTHGHAMVHGWIFDPRTDLITDLQINFADRLTAIQQIYNLTNLPWFQAKA